MNQEENEVSINLVDMFAYVLKYWKLALIIIIVSTAGIGGFLSYRDYKGLKNKYEESTYIEMVNSLNDEQKETVDQFYNRYVAYKERVADSQFYIDNSLKMKLDPNSISEYTKEYIIKSAYAGIILDSFCNSALDLDDYTDMASVLGNGSDPRFVNELIKLKGNSQQDAYDIDSKKYFDFDMAENSFTGILTVSITANDKETCEKLLSIADSAIKEHYSKLLDSGVEADMQDLSTSYFEGVDSELADYQRSMIEKGSDLVSEYYEFERAAQTTLDEDEQAVFCYLIDKARDVRENVNWKKWLVIGVAVGLVLAIVILVLRYLFIPGIKTVDDAFVITKEKEIGVVIQTAKSKVFLGKFFHNWAKKVEFHGVNQIPDSESIPLICDRIERICAGKNAKSIFLISDVMTGYSDEVIGKCLKLLDESGFIVRAGNPSASVDALKALRKSEVAVLALTNKKSLPDSIRSNKVVCEENNIPVVGNFIIHPQR